MWSPDEQAPQAIPASSNNTTATMNLRLFINPNNGGDDELLCRQTTTISPRGEKNFRRFEKSMYFCISIYS